MDIPRQKKTSGELVQMILEDLGFEAAYLVVVPDPEQGWRPIAMAIPSQIAAVQRRADLIAAELRSHFDLTLPHFQSPR